MAQLSSLNISSEDLPVELVDPLHKTVFPFTLSADSTIASEKITMNVSISLTAASPYVSCSAPAKASITEASEGVE